MASDLDFGQINGEILLIEPMFENGVDTYKVEIMNKSHIFKAMSLSDIIKEVYEITAL